jgi:uncharacterized protein (DUF1501 family)
MQTQPGIDRRRALELAARLGLSLALPALSAQAAARRGPERGRSLIVVWLDGGPSQVETWDPHPGTPIGGPTRAIKTCLPGVQIAEHFPAVAEQLDKLSLIRSLVSHEGDHARAMHLARTGYRPDGTLAHPSLGSIVARELPSQNLELPPFVSLGFNQFASRGGYLGGRYDAFIAPNPEAVVRAGRRAHDERSERRLRNVRVIADAFARDRRHSFAQTGFAEALATSITMLSSDQLEAFNLDAEPQRVRARYGATRVGRACLAARRLIELGVRVVEVTHHNYDTHENNFATTAALAQELDPALAVLVSELHERALWESTALLCMGEFGRTPKINKKEGRDHWPAGYSCLLGGAGILGGKVLGATDPHGRKKEPDQPVTIPDLFATILRALHVDWSQSVLTPIGRPIKLSQGAPLASLIPDA